MLALTSSVVDHEFELRSGQTISYSLASINYRSCEAILVVYKDGQSSIWGGGAGTTGSDVTKSDVSHVTGGGPDRKWRQSRKYVLRMRNRYILYYYYSSSTKCSTVVQVAWAPEVTECHVTPKEVVQYPTKWNLFTGSDVIKHHS